jgi:Tfp pilus assembly protein PilN
VITQPPPNFIAAHELPNGIELYGESESRAVYSAMLPMHYERAVSIARSELRIDPATPSVRLSALLPRPSLFPADYDPNSMQFEANVLPYATALAGACPWLGLEANLLPPELRRASSRVRLIPTFTLGGALLVILILLALQDSWADARYLGVLQHQIAKYEPAARKVETIDRTISTLRARSQSLDDFKRRSRLDIDSLAEITRLVPPPGWVSNLDMDRNTVNIGGEADQAEGLLKVIDKSPYFDKSELTMPITKSAGGEQFRIRAQRTVPALAPAAAGAAQQVRPQDAPAAAKPAGTPAPSPGAAAAPNPGGAK